MTSGQWRRLIAWSYPQFNFYAMWKYAQIAPEHTLTLYNLARSKLEVPVPASADKAYFIRRMWELNGWIAGYMGFLRLQELAGRSQADAALRAQAQAELNRLLSVWETIFSKDCRTSTTIRPCSKQRRSFSARTAVN